MSTEQGYRAIFNTYIVAGGEASLALVRDTTGQLADADRQQAWHALSYALGVKDAWPIAAQLLLALAPRMVRIGFWSEWLPFLERGLTQSQDLQDLDSEAEISFQLGHLCQRLSRLDQAEEYAAAAVRLFQQRSDPNRQGAALNRLADIARSKLDFETAERLTDSAFSLFATIPAADLDEQGHGHLIKGRIAFNLRDWHAAGRQFSQALRCYEQTENQTRIAVCMQNLGRVCTMEEDYGDAIAHYEQAITLLEAANDVFNLAAVQMNLGIVHSLCERPQGALEQYSKAESVFRRLQDRSHLARLFNNQGMEMNNLQRWAEAKALLEASSALCLELDNLQWYLNVQDALGLSYIGSKNFDQAIRSYEGALALSEKHADRTFPENTLKNLTKHLHSARQASEVHPQLS